MSVRAQLKTSHNAQLYTANSNLALLITQLVDYQIAHPRTADATSRAAIEAEKKAARELDKMERGIRSQLSLMKALYRQSVFEVRREKGLTKESRDVNDMLILQLHNLKYEEQSLGSEIAAAQNYDHKYTHLPLLPLPSFLSLFPSHADTSEQDLMTARIEHEYQVRVKLEERRQEKLKQKQMLIAEVKKRKADLEKLDSMLEKFIADAEPIGKVLAAE
ncbi:hypothetical protein K491DRAFT_598974 [Lophiostoma macrostomum CBS 122681]|uniref:Fms interacting protein n=1 Tax=Lophiostoma macrostomum CBS 122681 TaxID=1314788 RepID=A0A6A6T6Q0_9PLEO|nr:hypothetical protein K491DRAFT_598974 [Lophiostoma macrostomum CBS 122681]